MNSINLLLHVSFVKIVQVLIYDKKYKYIFKKNIVCRETRTHYLNLDSYTLCLSGTVMDTGLENTSL